jgi:anhydro-N-acetylmuramic acid kinase
MRAIGLMSGTSLDGIDAALVDIRPRGAGYALEVVRFATAPFEPAVREALLAALPPNLATAPLASIANSAGSLRRRPPRLPATSRSTSSRATG